MLFGDHHSYDGRLRPPQLPANGCDGIWQLAAFRQQSCSLLADEFGDVFGDLQDGLGDRFVDGGDAVGAFDQAGFNADGLCNDPELLVHLEAPAHQQQLGANKLAYSNRLVAVDDPAELQLVFVEDRAEFGALDQADRALDAQTGGENIRHLGAEFLVARQLDVVIQNRHRNRPGGLFRLRLLRRPLGIYRPRGPERKC